MTQEIKLGLVGYGMRGRSLLKLATTAFEGVRAAGICEPNPASLEQARADYPTAKHYAEFEAMLGDVSMDALLIETPAHFHAGFAIKALERNIHVLSDIPSVNTLEEARNLWEAQRTSKAFYMTGANPNMTGWLETARDLKKRGLFGEPYYIEAAYLHDCRSLWEVTPWRKPSVNSPKLPIQYCTHSLGPILQLIDEDLECVTCLSTGSHINKEPGQHDAMAALFRTKSNVVVRLLVSFINNLPGGGQHNYRFFTTKGAFERTLAYQTFQSKEHAEEQRTLFYSTELYGYKNWIELPIGVSRPEQTEDQKTAGHGGVDYALWEVFIKAVRAGGPSPISLREGLRMTLPGIFAAESARKGGELTRIKYPWSD